MHDENIDPNIAPEENLMDHEADGSGGVDAVIERRRFPRCEFTYPVEFKIFRNNSDSALFKGYLFDISVNGACLQFEDRYGRLDTKNINNATVKLSFRMPRAESISILADIICVRSIDPKNFTFKIGIEFKDMAGWQTDAVEKLIGMKNKDHNMIWSLWEQYEDKR